MRPKQALFSLSLLLTVSAAAVPITIVTQNLVPAAGGHQVGQVNPLDGSTSGLKDTLNTLNLASLEMFDVAVNVLGEIWGIDRDQNLWTIDPLTGKATQKSTGFAGVPPPVVRGTSLQLQFAGFRSDYGRTVRFGQ